MQPIPMPDTPHRIRSTTILCVRRDGRVALGGDGQVTMGNIVMKAHATKVRTLADGKVLAGFAGASADAFTLFQRFEAKMSEFPASLARAAVELAKDWRMDKYLRNLDALLAVAGTEQSLLISGTGDVIEPDDGVLAIGSGGPYAQSAARALLRHTDMDAEAIVREALGIAGEICVYTNGEVQVLTL